VYDPNATLAPKTDADGAATSVVSAAHIQAVMLEQAQLEPGMNVLEIGSSGYNAALIAELVGSDGAVTTIDIDPDIVARATTNLRSAGYDRVRVVQADAEHGLARYAPYDRIIVTARGEAPMQLQRRFAWEFMQQDQEEASGTAAPAA